MPSAVNRRVRKARLTAKRLWHFVQTPSNLARLRRHDHPLAAELAAVLEQWRRLEAFTDDDDAVAAIEQQRRQWRADERPLGELHSRSDETETVSRACKGSKPRLWSELLYALVRMRQPRVSLELGTNLGVSSAYQALALREKSDAEFHTADFSPARLKLAAELHGKLGLDPIIHYHEGAFETTLAGVVEQLGAIEYAFIDGGHEVEETFHCVNVIGPRLADNAVVVFDDIVWSEGMEQVWGKMRQDPRFAVTVDLFHVGLAITHPRDEHPAPPANFTVLRPWRKAVRAAQASSDSSGSGAR